MRSLPSHCSREVANAICTGASGGWVLARLQFAHRGAGSRPRRRNDPPAARALSLSNPSRFSRGGYGIIKKLQEMACAHIVQKTVSHPPAHVSGEGRARILEWDDCRVALALVPLHGSVGRCRKDPVSPIGPTAGEAPQGTFSSAVPLGSPWTWTALDMACSIP
jgi:hypothetical protein